MKTYTGTLGEVKITFDYPDGYRPIKLGERMPKAVWWAHEGGSSNIRDWKFLESPGDEGAIFDGIHYFSPRIVKDEDVNTTENMDKNNLTVTRERILEAAARCPTAKETLKTLFPAVFEDDKYYNLSEQKNESFFSNPFLCVQMYGSLATKGFYLSPNYNWEIVKDDQGNKILVPTKKG